MIRDTLRTMIVTAAITLAERGEIEIPDDGLPDFEVDRTQKVEFGDYFTNLAMKLARPPQARVIAQKLADHLNEMAGVVPAYDLVETVEVAGPGFINLRLRAAWLLRQASAIIAAGPNAGATDIGRGERVNLEFVSANPTGPVHIGNGRGGFIGDTLGNVMRAAGYDVTKEYYFNDFGQQIDKLGGSTAWYMAQIAGRNDIARPKEGYFDGDDLDGSYYADVARRVLAQADGPGLLDLPAGDERDAAIGSAAAQHIMADITKTMARLHIEFDVWFNQASLDRTGELESAIDALRERGYLYEQDGAVWMDTTEFGDDKDRVIIKADGEPTYIASDVAYVLNKLNRGFDRLIYVLGPDHHGYIGRLKASARMFGYDADRVHVLMYQQVNIKVEGASVRMSKRHGNVINLDELVDLVGPDVTRFFYLMRASDTHLDFDLQLAMKQGEENPGLSVQYGHARTAGVLRKAAQSGIDPVAEAATSDPAVLASDPPEQRDAELALMRELTRLEEVIWRCSSALEPHHLTKYGMDVAAAFHAFYDRCPILRADTPEQRAARCALTLAARTVLARALILLGMSVPERMERAIE
jgi:arginyl-tRNA synthetase